MKRYASFNSIVNISEFTWMFRVIDVRGIDKYCSCTFVVTIKRYRICPVYLALTQVTKTQFDPGILVIEFSKLQYMYMPSNLFKLSVHESSAN